MGTKNNTLQQYPMQQNRIVKPGLSPQNVISDSGQILVIPPGWSLLPPGDGPLTRLVKAKGPTWLVQVKIGRRLISKGVWASAENIEAARQEISLKRSSPDYLAKRQKALQKKQQQEYEYHNEFVAAILDFLDFHERYRDVAAKLADIVATHSTPVGSGTVARTRRIPLEERAGRAVIAWMRHATTAYDTMRIPRIKGKRRQVRSALAAQSVVLLNSYRQGQDIPQLCSLEKALARSIEKPGK